MQSLAVRNMLKLTRKPTTVASRMAWKLVLLSVFALSLADLFDLIPDPNRAEIQHKTLLTESLAITSSLLAQNQADELINENLSAAIQQHPDVLSARVRRNDGTIIFQAGDHQSHWHLAAGAPSTKNNIHVPILNGDQPWGSVELSFQAKNSLLAKIRSYPILLIALLTTCVNWITFRWYLSRAFEYLNRSKSVPMHMRATLDTFPEAVVVLDNDKRIVMANDTFKLHTGRSDEQLLGQDIDQLPWNSKTEDSDHTNRDDDSTSTKGRELGLDVDHEHRTYLVNSSAITGNDGKRRGTIASFDDIAPSENKRRELSKMLTQLQTSRDELTQRNKELKHLATRDPLTGCLNRRTFFEGFDKEWKYAERHCLPLSCFIVDVDHFKSVNDNHGHSVGDEVLQAVAKTIENSSRDSDIVCRYGGEEFCVMLPATDTSQAWNVAENLRIAIGQLKFTNLSITASIGVSSISLGGASPKDLLDEADKCLYAAKRAGRNQVIRWDEIRRDAEPCQSLAEKDPADTIRIESESSIPYQAVASLLSALAYRDSSTATHSTRVADLCVAVGSTLLSVKETYVLEVAALLHDIGKIGVPDAILLKPGSLNDEEWGLMKLHDRIGVEIVQASFSDPDLIDIVKFHHASFAGSPKSTEMPTGYDIPIAARILTVADSYDAMVSDRIYRKKRSPKEAFAELRRCAGIQFDPDIVERFISIVQRHQPREEVAIDSRQAALQVGLQIERLADAIDQRDSISIKALATNLESTAAKGGIPEIEAVAHDIKNASTENGDVTELLDMVDLLIALCRSTQKVHVQTSVKSETQTAADEAAHC